jgi:hypothetical protein
LLAGVVLLAFAGTAVASGLDRMAATNPALAPAVPGPFAALGPAALATVTLQAGDFATTERLARQSLANAPLEPGAAGLLGASLIGQNKWKAGDQAFRVAGRLGWRDIPTQLYWMQVSIATGDWDIAAERADAILRLDPTRADDPRIVGPFENDPRGRKALITRMAGNPPWVAAYLKPSPNVPLAGLEKRAEVLDEMTGVTGATCELVAPFAARLAGAHKVAQAFHIWRERCPGAGAGLLRDPSFAAADAVPDAPFEWRLASSGTVTVNAAEAGQGLEVASRASFPREFARQLLVLRPGAYRLSWREDGGRAGAGPRVIPAVGCDPVAGNRLTPTNEGARASARFTAGAACEGLWLTLLLAPGSGAVRVSDVRLEPA